MLMKLVQNLFPGGQRKVMLSLIAILIGVILDKFAGGLTENMMTVLISAVGFFTGGNIVEHIRGSFKDNVVVEKAVTEPEAPVMTGEQLPPDPGMMLDNAMNAVDRRFQEMDKKLSVQADNLGKLVQFINSNMARTPTRAPTPSSED